MQGKSQKSKVKSQKFVGRTIGAPPHFCLLPFAFCLLTCLSSLSCSHTVRTSKLAPVPARPTAIERQIRNAVDAGDGDYTAKRLRERMAAEPDNVAVRVELIQHFARL